jgi:hypothetical protein
MTRVEISIEIPHPFLGQLEHLPIIGHRFKQLGVREHSTLLTNPSPRGVHLERLTDELRTTRVLRLENFENPL